jgi:hypothetical protein
MIDRSPHHGKIDGEAQAVPTGVAAVLGTRDVAEMMRTQTSVAGLLIIMAGFAIILGVLSQPWERVANALLSLAIVAVPTACVLLLYGPDRVRAEALSLARDLLVVALGLLGLAASLLAVVIVAVTVLFPFDAVVLLAAVPTALVLLAAGCFALFGRGLRRAFGWGVVLFGLPVLIFGLTPAVSDRAPTLLTADLLHGLYPDLYLSSLPEQAPPAPTLGALSSRVTAPRRAPLISRSYLRLQRVGHYGIILGLALTGGLFARSLASGRERRRPGREGNGSE